MLLWKHDILQHGDNTTIAERMLTILCHIMKGEKELKEKFNQQDKQKDKKGKHLMEIQKTPAPTTFQIHQDAVDESSLQQVPVLWWRSMRGLKV